MKFVIFVLVVLIAPNALAYLDPGTGSILLQSMLALIAGAAFTLKLYWAKVKSLFAHGKPEPDHHADERD